MSERYFLPTIVKKQYRLRIGELYVHGYLQAGMSEYPYLRLTTTEHATLFDDLKFVRHFIDGITELDPTIKFVIEEITTKKSVVSVTVDGIVLPPPPNSANSESPEAL